MTITEFIEAQLARVEAKRCDVRTIVHTPMTIGGQLVEYHGMSGDADGTYIQVRGLDVCAMTPPGEVAPLMTRYLSEAEKDEFWSLCPLSGGAVEARRWVAAIRAVVELHRTWADDPWPECEVCRRPPPCQTVRAIAGIWADEDGWREEWL